MDLFGVAFFVLVVAMQAWAPLEPSGERFAKESISSGR
jgi:hypothetical protein